VTNLEAHGHIRLAQPEDVAAVGALVHAAYVHYVARIGAEPGPMRADYAALIAHAQVYVLIVGADAQSAGVLVLHYEPEVLWIENVAVDPRYQHHGLGRQLLAFAEDQARAAGSRELRLYTHELMVENIRLYQRLGYVEFDRRLDNGFRRVFMRKELQSG
jgi:ribosomal protein S18 acetylase RimI-like enzyme